MLKILSFNISWSVLWAIFLGKKCGENLLVKNNKRKVNLVFTSWNGLELLQRKLQKTDIVDVGDQNIYGTQKLCKFHWQDVSTEHVVREKPCYLKWKKITDIKFETNSIRYLQLIGSTYLYWYKDNWMPLML